VNLYLISRRDKDGYDEYVRVVAVAPSAHVAKQLIPADHGDDGSKADTAQYWTPKNLIAQCIGVAHARYTKPVILVTDFHWG
jgi:hypothetical protein